MPVEKAQLKQVVAGHFERSNISVEAFFQQEATRIGEACWAMARRFHQGGRLLSFGEGSSNSDAEHIGVEFVHPVTVGRRALPALALNNTPVTANQGSSFSRQLTLLARPPDIAIGLSWNGNSENVLEALKEARRLNLLTLAFTGGNGGKIAQANLDFCLVVPDSDPLVIGEVHRTLYHILWELVHLYFEHEGLLV